MPGYREIRRDTGEMQAGYLQNTIQGRAYSLVESPPPLECIFGDIPFLIWWDLVGYDEI